MADFLCKCVDSRGKMRTQWLKGAARDSLVHQAALRGFTLISVLKEKEPAAAGGSKKKRLNEKLVLEWSLALRSLLKGGITVREAIGIVGQVSPYRQLKDLCGHAVSRIDGGSTLMEALEDYQSGFSPVYTGLIAAGERTGRLDSVLESLIAQMKRSRKLKEKMVSAAVYPAIVMSALVLGLLLLFLLVLPRVAASFADMGMGADLSALAGKAIRSGLAIAAVTGTLVLTLAASAAFSRSGKGGAAFRRALDRLVLGIPVAGRLAADSQMFLLASSMSALLDQGTSMEKALGLSARAVSNSWLRQSLERIQGRLEKGVGLYEAANEEPSLPAYVKGWIGVGEQTASMDRVFDQLKGFYGDRLDESIERVTAAMEPVLIVTVGAVIIYVLYAFIIPVFGAFTTLI